MKTVFKLCVLACMLITIACNNEDEEIILDSSTELENFEGEFEAKEFEAKELEAKELEAKGFKAIEKSGRFYLTITREDAFNPILGEVSGKSTLIRGRRGIWGRYRSNKLIAGHAYTLWWVIWNKPENCATPNQCVDTDFANPAVEVELLYASGRIARRNGKATFYSRLRAGNDSGSINDLFGLSRVGGLQKGNTFSSEVHMVVRSHGPKILGQIYEQVTSYVGGCSDPFAIAPFTEIPYAQGECGDIEFSIHAPIY